MGSLKKSGKKFAAGSPPNLGLNPAKYELGYRFGRYFITKPMPLPSRSQRCWSGLMVVFSAVVVGALGLAGYAQEAGPAKAHRIDYNWEVRPILSDNCYRCHGPDAKARQAGLRLDQKESAYAQAIDLGNPNKSELMKRITSKDPAYRMPPPAASAKSLTDAEVATLREWIREGAEFKPHWAFVAPIKVEPPQLPAGSHAVNVIDSFILARLAKEGLKPSREVSASISINRVSLIVDRASSVAG